jgi:hypothetical protein
MTGDEDHRDVDLAVVELLVQFEAAEPRHAHVKHHASRPGPLERLEEGIGRLIGFGFQPQ